MCILRGNQHPMRWVGSHAATASFLPTSIPPPEGLSQSVNTGHTWFTVEQLRSSAGISIRQRMRLGLYSVWCKQRGASTFPR